MDKAMAQYFASDEWEVFERVQDMTTITQRGLLSEAIDRIEVRRAACSYQLTTRARGAGLGQIGNGTRGLPGSIQPTFVVRGTPLATNTPYGTV
jgi:hypothetical protein